MQSLVSGFNGWLKPERQAGEALQLVDMILTTIAATLIALTLTFLVR